jgi:phosphatidylglycerol:prolipoprotein diacylglycerol transferase
MFPILLKLGPLTLHTYGLMVALAFLVAYTLSRHRLEAAGLTVPFIDNLALAVMFGGVVGARILFFIVDPGTHFLQDPLAFFRVWEGGLVYFGGFLGALLAITAASRLKELPFFLITDGFSAPLLLGQALGRLGCFAAGCCYGRPTSEFFGVTFTRADSLAPLGVALHPSQLYESLGSMVLFGGLLLWERFGLRRGESTAYYLVSYGVLRFFLETLRGDDRGLLSAGLSPSQIISGLAMAAGIGVWVYARRRA